MTHHLLPVEHPTKFSKTILETIEPYLRGRVLDPMAGVGTLATICGEGVTECWLNELELEWSVQSPNFTKAGALVRTTVADARYLTLDPRYEPDSFTVIATSPVYGNRTSDHHVAKDLCKRCDGSGAGEKPGEPCPTCRGKGLSRRHTYRHLLGRELTDGNTGMLQFGQEYQEAHVAIWQQCAELLQPFGNLIVNVSDFIRRGERVEAVAWHREALFMTGLKIRHMHWVETPRMRHGQNHELRVDSEAVMVWEKT